MRAQLDPAWWTPYHTFCRAILVDALATIGHRLGGSLRHHDYCEAMLWLYKPTREDPQGEDGLDYESICVALRIDPQRIRDRIGRALLGRISIFPGVKRSDLSDGIGVSEGT